MILQDKVSLVTGGTAGIGQATAIAFGAAGAKVVFSGTRSAIAKTTGYLVVLPMIIPDCPTSMFEKPEQRQYFSQTTLMKVNQHGRRVSTCCR